jgi:hypothetical protein
MWRISLVSSLVLLALLPAMALGASAHKRHSTRWHGYDFLPGYQQPPNNNIPVYGERGAIRGTPAYTPSYWYDGARYYFGSPGFYHGRYNGGSFGPCWTITPIGRVWNCG